MSLVKLLQDATGKRSIWDIVKQAGVYIVRTYSAVHVAHSTTVVVVICVR